MVAGYSHILWATDLIEENNAVGERASELAQHYDAKLSVLHVVDNLPLYYGHEMVLPETVEIERTLETRAKEKIATLAQCFGIDEADAHVDLNVVNAGVLNFADGNEVDLIVLGSHSRKGLGRLLGSTARAVVTSATCDVLAVRM